jgi:TolA-binding protein
MTSCEYFKKKVPPQELFNQAEQHRKNEDFVKAARLYDELIATYEQSELAPAALYYSGICKYTLSLRTPGKTEFEQRKGGLSESKKDMYAEWIDYLSGEDDQFLYLEAIDKFVYKGTEFKTLLDRYPASNLADDAAFQLVHTHLTAKQLTNTLTLEIALQLYAEYFADYPQSPYRQKGIEHLLQLASQASQTLLNHDEIVAAYQQLAQAADRLPEVQKLAYLLGIQFLKVKDVNNAAIILDAPGIIGIGVVETESTRLNIRSGQGTEYRIVGKAEKGEQLLLLSKSGQWYNVRLQDGTIGYAHADFIREYQP